jgi:hypothetical protein
VRPFRVIRSAGYSLVGVCVEMVCKFSGPK